MENEEIIDIGMTHGPIAIQIMYKKHVFVFNFIVHCLALFPTVLLPYIQRGANDVAIVATYFLPRLKVRIDSSSRSVMLMGHILSHEDVCEVCGGRTEAGCGTAARFACACGSTSTTRRTALPSMTRRTLSASNS